MTLLLEPGPVGADTEIDIIIARSLRGRGVALLGVAVSNKSFSAWFDLARGREMFGLELSNVDRRANHREN